MVKKIITGILTVAMSLSLMTGMVSATDTTESGTQTTPTYKYTLGTSESESFEDDGIYYQYITVYCPDIDDTQYMASGTTVIDILTDNVDCSNSYVETINLLYKKKQGSKYVDTAVDVTTNCPEKQVIATFGVSQAAFLDNEDGAFYDVCIAAKNEEAVEFQINGEESTIQLCNVTSTYGCTGKGSILWPNKDDETVYVLKNGVVSVKSSTPDPEPEAPTYDTVTKLDGTFSDGDNDNAVAFVKTFAATESGKLYNMFAKFGGVEMKYKNTITLPTVADGRIGVGVVIQYGDSEVTVSDLRFEEVTE